MQKGKIANRQTNSKEPWKTNCNTDSKLAKMGGSRRLTVNTHGRAS